MPLNLYWDVRFELGARREGAREGHSMQALQVALQASSMSDLTGWIVSMQIKSKVGEKDFDEVPNLNPFGGKK